MFAVTPTAPPSIQFTASPTNGIPPQAVQFSAPGVDDKGNTLLAWYWNFGDGTPTFTITITTNRTGVIVTNYNYISTQNPLHTYTNNGPFFPSLTAENINGTTIIIGSGPVIDVVYPGLILNGGFETGTFTNWTRTGIRQPSISTACPLPTLGHTRNATLRDRNTRLSCPKLLPQFPELLSGEVLARQPVHPHHNEFQVTWNGNVLMDQTNIPNIGWTNIQFTVTATARLRYCNWDIGTTRPISD